MSLEVKETRLGSFIVTHRGLFKEGVKTEEGGVGWLEGELLGFFRGFFKFLRFMLQLMMCVGTASVTETMMFCSE